jgi:glycosyltransferase involved in cell wall biosynthesis
VLFLAKQFPWPTNVGARQRSFHLARGLARTHDVTVVALDDPPDPSAREAFLAASGCGRVLFVSPSTCRGEQPEGPPAPRVVRALRALRGLVRSPLPDALLYWWSDALVAELGRLRREGGVDVVFASQSWMAEHARAAGFERIVVDVDDLLSELSRQQLRQRGWYPRRPLDLLRASQERAYERSLPARFTRVLVAKEEDRAFFPAGARGRVAVLPNGVSIPEAPAPDPECADTLLFVGTLGYPPNVDAVTWFAREVLPLVWEARPDVRFQVAGFGTGRRLAAEVLADPRCAVAESPPELAPFYTAAAVVVTPVRTGGGTRIKVLEALAYGKALVSTRFGPEGLSLRGGVDLELADTPRAMADACLALLGDPARRRALGAAGRARVAERYDWRRIEERLDSLLPLPGR